MSALLCHHCRTAVPEVLFNTGTPVACPRCQTSLFVRVFPAYFRAPAAGAAAEGLGSAEDAGCFYHPRKKAVVPCADCGRFLCALCDLEIDGQHVCPACAGGAGPGRGLAMGRLEAPRVLHDSMALHLAVLSLLLAITVVLPLFTAPVALFLVARYWNEPPQNPLGRTRARLVAAALVSAAYLLGLVWLFAFAFRSRF